MWISFVCTHIIKYLLLYILIEDIGQEKNVNNKKINILKLNEAERKKISFKLIKSSY